MRRTADWDMPNVRAIAAGLTPALKDARMKFAFPCGTSSIPSALGTCPAMDWPRDDVALDRARLAGFWGAAWLRRLISAATASSSFRNWASSTYLSASGRLPGSVTRFPSVDRDGAPDAGILSSRTFGDAPSCRLELPSLNSAAFEQGQQRAKLHLRLDGVLPLPATNRAGTDLHETPSPDEGRLLSWSTWSGSTMFRY